MWNGIADFPPALYQSQSVSLNLDSKRLLVIFLDDRSRENAELFLEGFTLALEDSQDHLTHNLPRHTNRVTHTKREFWAISKSGGSIPDSVIQELDNKIGSILEAIAPVYQFSDRRGRDGILSPLPSVLLLRKQPDLSPIQENDLDEAIRSYGLKNVPSISRYLSFHKYCVLAEPVGQATYDLLDQIPHDIPKLVSGASIEPKRMLSNHAAIPTDQHYTPNGSYPGQWNLVKINAGAFPGGPAITGWDKAPLKGKDVKVAVIDSGIDSTHVEFNGRFSVTGDPLNQNEDGAHGTACAGIIGASWDDPKSGIAGMAGSCTFISLAVETIFFNRVATAINEARAAHGARVINMSFGSSERDLKIPPGNAEWVEMEAAITVAYNAGVVLYASSGDYEYYPVPGQTELLYPANASDRVIACGATDKSDQRCTNPYQSNFGNGLSVVAPGVDIPTTDIMGMGGYSTQDYVLNFWGTSAATAHVSGLAALLLGEYPGLTPDEVRAIIEKTADQVGGYKYDPALSRYAGRGWNPEMGYGRINVLSALIEAPNYSSDIFIRDYPGDTGTVPSTPPGGNFWEFSDIVVHSVNDVAAGLYVPGTFDPADVLGSSAVRRLSDNYLFVRVTNTGPAAARNVVVEARIVPYAGLEFSRHDWVITDTTHLRPIPIMSTFPHIPAGASFIAAFTIPLTQVNSAWGWQGNGLRWHPCILASVKADNDYGFLHPSPAPSLAVLDFNNLAQRNVSVVVVSVLQKSIVQFPFVLGAPSKEKALAVELEIDMGSLASSGHRLRVLDNPAETFPELHDIAQIENLAIKTKENAPARDQVYGLEIPITMSHTVVRINPLGPRTQPREGKHYALELALTIPPDLDVHSRYPIRLRQVNDGHVVGGATLIVTLDEMT